MTVPNFDFLKPQSPTPTAPAAPTEPDFSFLAPQPKPESAWERLSKVSNNLRKLYHLGQLDNPSPEALASQAEYIKARDNVDDANDEFAAAKAAIDLRDIFKKFAANPSKSFKEIGEGVSQMASEPSSLITGIAEGFMRMPLSFVEGATGVSFQGENLEAMTPEQRAGSIKETVGNIVGLATGGVANKAMETAFVKAGQVGLASAMAAEHTTQGIAAFQRGVVKGALARKVSTGLVEGTAFGSAQSAVMYANDEQQLSQMLLNGVVFAPLGVVTELTIGRKQIDKAGAKLLYDANGVFQARQMQFTMDQSLLDITEKVEILKTADDIADALVKEQIKLNDNGVVHVTGIKEPAKLIEYKNKIDAEWKKKEDIYFNEEIKKNQSSLDVMSTNVTEPQRLAELRSIYGPDEASSRMIAAEMIRFERSKVNELKIVAHTDKKGNTNALFYNDNAPSYIKDSLTLYERYGFVKGEVVSFNGTDVIVRDYAPTQINHEGGSLTIENPQTNKRQIVARADLRRKFNGPREPQKVAVKSVFNLKGRFIKELMELKKSESSRARSNNAFDQVDFAGSLLTPLEQESQRAWAQTKTGQAVSIPAFRFQRGQAIANTGRFYGTTLQRIASYVGYGNKGRNIGGYGPAHGFVVHKLEFKNPVVIDTGNRGAHNAIWKELTDPTSELRKLIPEPDPKLIQALSGARDLTFTHSKTAKGLHEESGYQLQDVIIAKLLKAAGFDGIVYKMGSAKFDYSNTYVVDLRGTSVMDNKTSIEGVKLGAADAEVFQQKMFDDWRKSVVEAQAKNEFIIYREEQAKIAADAQKAKTDLTLTPEARKIQQERYNEAIDNIAGASDALKMRKIDLPEWEDQIPIMSFAEATNSFFTSRGFQPEEITFMRRDFERRIYNELSKTMDPFELEVIERLRNEADEFHTKQSAEKTAKRQQTIKDLQHNAASNGFYIDKEDADNIILRNYEDDKIMGKFKDLDEANAWINETGQANGIDLDGGDGNALPPSITGIHPPSGLPDHPNQIPDFVPLQGRMATIVANINSSLEWLTPNRGAIAALDQRFTQYKTDFFNKIFDRGQTAVSRRNAQLNPWYEKLKGIEDDLGNMSLRDREIIASYMETMSPDEMLARGGPGGKALNQAEIGLGKYLSDKKLDVTKLFKYRRSMNEARTTLGQNSPEFVTARQEINDKFALSTDEAAAIDVMDSFLKIGNGSLGPAVRYARSIMNGDVNRTEFAAKHKMTPAQIKAANKLDKMYEELATRFGIDPKNKISNYMTHARLYDNGKISDTLAYYGSAKLGAGAEEFYASLTRTGEIDAYETDPIRAVQRYIKAGMDAEILNPAIKEMETALSAELIKLPDAEREKAQTIAKRYITDLRGMPNAADRFAQQGVDNIMSKLGIESSVDLRRSIVNFLSASFEAGAQGFRLIAGLRDFSTGLTSYYARFGAKRTANMLRYGVAGYENITKAKLAGENIIPTLTPIYFDTPTDMSGRVVGRATNKIGAAWRMVTDKALAASGQRAVYGMFHAGAYIDTWKLSGEQINKFREGKVKWAEVQKNLGLRMYDQAVQKGFQDKVTAGDYEGAANFLARQTGSEVIGVYGMANHPSGWNRNIGRIAGQFGSWSMFYRTYLTRLASQGTYGERFGAMARFGAGQAAIASIAYATGVNLASWMAPAGIFFSGGPLLGLYEDMHDYMNATGYEQDRAGRQIARTLSLLVPGIQAMRDIGAANTLSEEGASDAAVLGRAVGFRQRPEE